MRGKSGKIHLVVMPKDTKTKGFKDQHFALAETIKEAIGEVDKASIDSKTDNYIVRVKSEEQAKKLLKLKKLKTGFKIKVTKHDKLNTCKVVIHSHLVTHMEDEQLQKALNDQGVIAVKSIPTNRVTKILTLKTSEPPTHINIGLIRVNTEKYYPMPKTCRTCQAIGHVTEDCNDKRCGNCSDRHNDANCDRAKFCWNCCGNHRPLSKGCPCYNQEKQIIKIQIDRNITPRQARAIYKKQTGTRYIPLPKPTDPESDEESNEEDQNESLTRPKDRSPKVTNEEDDEVVLLGEDALGHPPVVPRPKLIKEEHRPGKTERPKNTKSPKTKAGKGGKKADALGHPSTAPAGPKTTNMNNAASCSGGKAIGHHPTPPRAANCKKRNENTSTEKV